MDISFSKLKAFQQCKKQYYYKFVECLIPRAIYAPFLKGKIIHEFLQSIYTSGKFLSKEEIDELVAKHSNELIIDNEVINETPQDLAIILQEYQFMYREDFEKYRVHAIEKPFEMYLEDVDVILTGRIDGIWEEDQIYYVVEHKSMKRMKSFDLDYSYRPQVILYMLGAKYLGYPISGVIWNFIRTESPQPLKILKNGKVSFVHLDNTTSHMFIEQLSHPDANAITPIGEYERALLQLQMLERNNESKFFRRFKLKIDETTKRNVLKNVVTVVDEIRSINWNQPISRHIGEHCKRCPYLSLCQAEIRGWDMKQTLMNFKIEPKKEESIKESEELEEKDSE